MSINNDNEAMMFSLSFAFLHSSKGKEELIVNDDNDNDNNENIHRDLAIFQHNHLINDEIEKMTENAKIIEKSFLEDFRNGNSIIIEEVD
jgi:hypothetical protein